MVQRFRGSGVQRFRVQGFKGSGVQRFRVQSSEQIKKGVRDSEVGMRNAECGNKKEGRKR
jgi:hypothetical protein